MVQKSSVKKDALLPWSQRGRVGGRAHVFTPSPQSPPPLLQLPGGKKRGKSYTTMPQVGSNADWNLLASKGTFAWLDTSLMSVSYMGS